LSEGLVRSNERVYDLLTLGKSLQQSIEGDLRSFPFQYIDWQHLENNVYHVTEELSVERQGTTNTRRPDIVLFANGIPLAVIECKAPDGKDPLGQAISQMIRNQKEGEIPHLFHYSQVLLAVCGNAARFGTTATESKYWSAWKEKEGADRFEAALGDLVNRPLAEADLERMVEAGRELGMPYRNPAVRGLNSPRRITEQDRAICALLRPARLLELAREFVLFDGPDKKIARYQQYFAVKKIMDQIRVRDENGARAGGVVWHTQGSGKSLTMVMLARAIALAEDIPDYRIVLVTDRIDLDEQLKNNFLSTGAEVFQAGTGVELSKLLVSPKSRIITTVINKFEAAVGRGKTRIEDPNIFVLVDEGHRTQYGVFHARMRQALPNACYIGFTGTPVMQQDKDTVERFGGLIDTYTIGEAVEDKAVVELLYEGRHAHQVVDREAIDTWFERETRQISEAQAGYLKTRFAATDPLNKAAQKVRELAWDISEHYVANWQGTGFKGQLVAQDKEHALLFRDYLGAIDHVHAEVLISGPDEREGETDVHAENKQAVQRFWKEMMSRYGSEAEYNKQLIHAFKFSDVPEILIVVDKLLTGFDAPRNTVLYLTRPLRDHALLQAIARVNRLHEGKDFGYIIDYAGVLGNLSDALDLYSKLPGFDPDDLKGILTDVAAEVRKLSHTHAVLWDTFKEIENKGDVEEYEQHLRDQERRDRFYDRLAVYSKTLGIALGSVHFLEDTPADEISRYKNDLKFFTKLRASVKRRYAETLDYAEYEPRIRKLLDMYVGTEATEQITPLVNIFEKEAFAQEVARLETVSARADTIAHRTSRTIYERMDEDPVFYQRFSSLLQQVIDAYRQRRIDENAYLIRVSEIMDSVANRTGDDIPATLAGRDVAKAYFGIVNAGLSNQVGDADLLAEIALEIETVIDRNRIVQWVDNPDVQNKMRMEIEDRLFEFAGRHGIELDFVQVDEILERCLEVARHRRADVG
ncbi:MAG TPA: HsdR family type I site-specific deoxyribonuclease, partial [Anaerolineales bacterium]|nr:HsdR family type I site-specific deoxyribonuclease [Anaerolineales bacterium]